MPVERWPRAARERMANPPAGTAPRSAFQACRPDKRLSERVALYVTVMGTIVKGGLFIGDDPYGQNYHSSNGPKKLERQSTVVQYLPSHG